MKTKELREKFLDYFDGHGHRIVAGSPLVPANDPTLLFTNAGMVQFKDVFLGLDKRDYIRATTVQRCLRAGGKHNDLENVGYTARHHTFFEMLGNFSFGDYFKERAIKYSWDFLTKVLGLSEDKLWVTVYEDDAEAEDIWLNGVGVSANRFSRCGAGDNFWSMGNTGPCGPCSEIFYDHGPKVAGGPPGSPDEDGDRYIEIWNLVFMQFNRDAGGEMTPLPKPSVDTGMGLERLAAAMQGVHSNYEIDLFQNLMRAAAKIIGIEDYEHTSMKVIADHIRSCAFLAVDGVVPSNERRGYVMRRIIRRALRHGFKLGAKEGFFHKLVAPLVVEMGPAYPELKKAEANVTAVLEREEKKFAETLEQGMTILDNYMKNLSGTIISGEVAFKLYDTYGFPLDLTQDVAREQNLSVDVAGYEKHMQSQRNRARKASNFKQSDALDLDIAYETEFTGYSELKTGTRVEALLIDEKPVEAITKNQKGIIILDKTPFYAESGGQIADSGLIIADGAKFEITDVQKQRDTILHYGVLVAGNLKVGDALVAKVNPKVRKLTTANHSATHLLYAALKQVLGEHVSQKGSMVSAERLRFDFSHPQPVSKEELEKIEALVNFQIEASHPVTTEIMDIEKARDKGAMALFGEKYADKVRVLSMSDFSIELCGGTHVENTADISSFKIIAETGIASGIRRIEAVAGNAAIGYLGQSDKVLAEISAILKTSRTDVLSKVTALIDKQKFLEKEINALNQSLAKSRGSDLLANAIEVNGIKVLIASIDGMDIRSLRDTVDELKSKLENAVVLLAAVNANKVSLVCGVTNNSTDKVKAGDVVKQLAAKIGGQGGGRPDMAQGGGTDVAALAKALDGTRDWVMDRLN